MKSLSALFLAVLAFAPPLLAGPFGEQESNQGRETVLDRITHIEKELLPEVPRLPRLCDLLDLKKNRVEVGDCRLYVEEEGKGMPLVLVNGGPGGTHHYFHPHFTRAKDFARVIYYDQRGCGLSGYKRGMKYTMDQAADDLDNLRKALKIERWVVLGHSYGGLLAQYYAMKYPQSAAGLVLVGSSLGTGDQLKPTRQYDYISQEERTKMQEISKGISLLAKEKNLSEEDALALRVFNNMINGDWKRQNFYRPSREDLARKALYEWNHDRSFRGDINGSINKIDLKGAFQDCPIPTLIMEGTWDLTWNVDKPGILHKNHPGAKLVMFQKSSHNPFEDEPEIFFTELKDFIGHLPSIRDEQYSDWRRYLEQWKISTADPLLISEMTAQEALAVEEYNRIRDEILQGKRYEDMSTPLGALLSYLSALHFRDFEAYSRLRPGVDLDQEGKPVKVKEETLAQYEEWYIEKNILRVPSPPENPSALELWPIYIADESGKEWEQAFVFVFWERKWRWAGNSYRDWRKAKDFFLNYFLNRIENLKKQNSILSDLDYSDRPATNSKSLSTNE